MPTGVDVAVEDGFATIEFVDPSLRGPGLGKLLEVGTPPELIEKVTRPRLAYIVPEGNARLAGLLDEAPKFASGGPIPADADLPEALPDTGHTVPASWPDSEPDDGWKRAELDAYAAAHGIDTRELPNKTAALAAIQEVS
ncbi:hypothetical protein [Mycobacterium sp. DL440]|uniref:hypothetical protein n=1 Tax=Mycobacterium sp. DL440 TaxID=2675523 RepID=UPI00141FD9F9|nr:hypothetical protein [Mycobacterium sp. DL440]